MHFLLKKSNKIVVFNLSDESIRRLYYCSYVFQVLQTGCKRYLSVPMTENAGTNGKKCVCPLRKMSLPMTKNVRTRELHSRLFCFVTNKFESSFMNCHYCREKFRYSWLSSATSTFMSLEMKLNTREEYAETYSQLSPKHWLGTWRSNGNESYRIVHRSGTKKFTYAPINWREPPKIENYTLEEQGAIEW